MPGGRGFSRRSMLFLLALQGIASQVVAAEPDPVRIQRVLVDEVGDPLPEGAVARIGTVRLRQPSEVCSVAFSPEGKLLATGGRYDGVRLWNATTGKLLHFLTAKGGQGIFCLAFSPDGRVNAFNLLGIPCPPRGIDSGAMFLESMWSLPHAARNLR